MQAVCSWCAGLAGLALVIFVLRDAFETMILPRRLNGRLRVSRLFFQAAWPLWAGAAGRFHHPRRRESALSTFGPLSMLLLFALWAVALIGGFALIFWSLGSPLQTLEPIRGLGMDVYLSGVMLLTLGLGSAVPHTGLSRILAVSEGGLGLGFLAIIISYLPVLYSGFSSREASIAMLDARAGSPPTASELLCRHASSLSQLGAYLSEWERWSAQLLESHISYPVLGYFRSQHLNQSWLSALTALLDTCALLLAANDNGAASPRRTSGEDSSACAVCTRQAQLTSAIARHAVVDLAQIYARGEPRSLPDRLDAGELAALRRRLAEVAMPLQLDAESVERLSELRRLYEPHVVAIGARLRLNIPPWVGDVNAADNWQRSPWDRSPSSALGRLRRDPVERHF